MVHFFRYSVTYTHVFYMHLWAIKAFDMNLYPCVCVRNATEHAQAELNIEVTMKALLAGLQFRGSGS